MIDRTYLTVSTFVKRHWGVVLFLLLLLLIVPPFIDSLARLWNTITRILFPGKALADAGTKVINKLLEKPGRKWLIVAPSFFLSPLLGAALTVWALLDYFKQPPPVSILPSPETPPTPSSGGGFDRAVDDYFA